MMYTTIISLLIEKLFYLLRPQSFSLQIVSEFIDTSMKFSNSMSLGWAFDSLFCPKGRIFVHKVCPGGRVFALFKLCPGGMVLDETDTCIRQSTHFTLSFDRYLEIFHLLKLFGLFQKEGLEEVLTYVLVYLDIVKACNEEYHSI